MRKSLHALMAESTKHVKDALGGAYLESPLFFHFHVDHLCPVIRTLGGQCILGGGKESDNRLIVSLKPQPFVCKDERIREALVNIDARKGGIALDRADYPLRRDYELAETSRYLSLGDVILGSDVVLHLNIDGEKKILHVQRDAKAPTFPFYWTTLGGIVTEEPSRTALREFNEEMGILLEHGSEYLLVLGRYLNETGMGEWEKERQIVTLKDQAAARYENFDILRGVRLVCIDLEDVPYDAVEPVELVTKYGDEVVDATRGYITLSPQRSVVVVERPLALPSYVDGIPALGSLMDGKNCFFVEAEFGLVSAPLTLPQMAYINREGKFLDHYRAFLEGTKMLDGVKPVRGLKIPVRGGYKDWEP